MTSDLLGLHVVVTAGGTAEPIDPVRIITNLSTGKMGTALAQAAAARGAAVTLISSAGRPNPPALRFVPMTTVESLRAAVLHECSNADMLFMAAAVSDFRPVESAQKKIKKTGGRLTLEFDPIPDFMCEVNPTVFKIGFAAESAEDIDNAWAKFDTHGFEIVCANPIDEPGSGFGSDTNRVTILQLGCDPVPLPCLPKTEASDRILDHALAAYSPWLQSRGGADPDGPN